MTGIIWFLTRSFFMYTILTFGNGPIMIPLIQQDFVAGRHLISQEQLLYAFTIARVTPGQANLYVAAIGYMTAGLIGTAASMAAILAPGYLMLLFTHGYERLKGQSWVQGLTKGLTVTSVGLILAATFDIARSSLSGTAPFVVFGTTVVLIQFMKMNTVLALVSASALGIAIKLLFPAA